jgi:hypothetical protein
MDVSPFLDGFPMPLFENSNLGWVRVSTAGGLLTALTGLRTHKPKLAGNS